VALALALAALRWSSESIFVAKYGQICKQYKITK